MTASLLNLDNHKDLFVDEKALRLACELLSPVVDMNKHADLFKSKEDHEKFLSLLRANPSECSLKVVMQGHTTLVGTIPPEQAELRLKEEILLRLKANPATLDTLKERIMSDDLVD